MSSIGQVNSSARGLFVLKEELEKSNSNYSLSDECYQMTLELRDIITKYKR